MQQSGFSATNIAGAATTTVFSGTGILHSIVVNKSVASATITVYDNTAASGTKIATITLSTGGVTDQVPLDAIYDVNCALGCTIVTSGATDITATWVTAGRS